MKYLAALLGAALLCASPAAFAQQASYESGTRPQAEMLDALLVRECAQNDRALRWVTLEELSYPLLGDRQVRDSGTRIYTERYEATGCGAEPRRINVQVFHGGAQAPEPRAMLLPPGETAVSAGVMVDLFRTHMPQLIALRHPTCRTPPPGRPLFIVTDTKLLSGTPFVVGETWTERWDYLACDEAQSVDISFVSHGDRVTMNMQLSVAAPPAP